MPAITASMVAELRAKTDAPMMECKKALTEADGDMGRAILKGSAFGIPLVFVILFLIDMFAGLSVPLAAPHRRAPGTTEPSADRS